mgnify:FL=1
MNPNPLTAERAAALWNSTISAGGLLVWDDLDDRQRASVLGALQAAHQAGIADAALAGDDGWRTIAPGERPEVGMEAEVSYPSLKVTGIVSTVADDGTVWNEDDRIIGSLDDGEWRVRPVPGPPPVWVTLDLPPTTVITDATNAVGDRCYIMVADNTGSWVGVKQDGCPATWPPAEIATCVHEGDNLTRDGETDTGQPRFRKEAAEPLRSALA